MIENFFRTLAEPLIDGQILIPQSWPRTSDIVTLVSLGVAGICVVLCILLCIKVRKISTSLLILQEVQHAASEEVPSFIYNKLVTSTPSNLGGDCVLIPLVQLSLCPSYYTITIPSILDISASKCPSFYLDATWETFFVTDKQTETTLTVPSKFKLNPNAHRKLT